MKLSNIPLRFTRIASIRAFLSGTFALLIGASGCTPPPTVEESQAAYDHLAAGQARVDELATQLSNTLATLRVIPVVQLLINEPPTHPIPQYESATIQPYLGFYKENTLGSYDFQGGGQSVVIDRLNGVHIELYNFFYDNSARLSDLRIKVTSGAQTPANEQITMELRQERGNLVGAIIPAFLSAGIRLSGTATFPNPSGLTPTDVRLIARFVGSVESAVNTNQSIQTGERLWIEDRTETTVLPPVWDNLSFVRHVPSDQLGTWVGEIAGSRYNDRKVVYNMSLLLQSRNVQASGEAVYLPATNTILGSAFIGVNFAGKKVAHLVGGPYSCDVNQPTSAGSGDPITLNWIHPQIDPVFPNSEYPCERTIIKVPG